MIIKINKIKKQVCINNEGNNLHSLFFTFDEMNEDKTTIDFYKNRLIIVIINKLNRDEIKEVE